MSSDYLPIAITATADKEFDGWYNSEDKLMSASDLVNVIGHETWTAKFIDIEPTSVHLNFSVGSTNGIDSVPLEDVALTVGGVAITAKESANGFILGGTTYLDPTLSLQAASACNTPLGVSGTVSGYELLGTFITTGKLDVDNTGQLETGEFFVGLETAVQVVNFTTDSGAYFIGANGLITTTTTREYPISKMPIVMVTTGQYLNGYTDVIDDSEIISNPADFQPGHTYRPFYASTSSARRLDLYFGVGENRTVLTGTLGDIRFNNLTGCYVLSDLNPYHLGLNKLYLDFSEVEIPNFVGYQGVTSDTSLYAGSPPGTLISEPNLADSKNYSAVWFA